MTHKFERLLVAEWRQYHKVDIEFHHKLTVITGANGVGKSGLLSMLTQHFGWQKDFLGTPSKVMVQGQPVFRTDMRCPWEESSHMYLVGSIVYAPSGAVPSQLVGSGQGVQYAVEIENQQRVFGTFIPSHRATPVFHYLQSVQLNSKDPNLAYREYQQTSIERVRGHHGESNVLRMKQALVSMVYFGTKTEFAEGSEPDLKNFRGFNDVLLKVLPPTLRFKNLSIRQTEVVLETGSGDFVLDAASGGILAIIDIAWQIYIYSLTDEVKIADSFVVVIDEPENHLHPSMQRALISDLINAFPKAQFIIATHSPFMVSSVKDSYVYVLKYEDIERKMEGDDLGGEIKVRSLVVSERLDVVNRAGSAGEILRDVLGVAVTVPLWVEDRLHGLLETYRKLEFNAENVLALKEEMTQLGFGELYPQALAELVGK